MVLVKPLFPQQLLLILCREHVTPTGSDRFRIARYKWLHRV